MTEKSYSTKTSWDAIIIGGGFYGCQLALYLNRNNWSVIIVEREDDLLTRASYANQARVHNGYHYPRNFMTAWRSFVNFPRFTLDFKDCIDNSFEKVYAIARQHSKVNAYQFMQLFKRIGAPIKVAPARIKQLFNERLIEEVFLVEEYAFDAVKLRQILREKLDNTHVPILLESAVEAITQRDNDYLDVMLANGQHLTGNHVFNCTYAQINAVLRSAELDLLPLKHEVTELALVEVPADLKELGITVMDGPFFSVMPFPAHGLHTLSHVRYTPHEAWIDLQDGYRNPYNFLANTQIRSNFPYMQRDAQRYIPMLADVQYKESLYEIKTVLVKNEQDDGRPILFRKDYQLRGFHTMMGGKIDNIYDMLGGLQEFTKALNPTEKQLNDQ